MTNGATASRFATARTAQAKDRSSGKTIITGDSGIGKTYFLSTIESDDKRPIFLLPIEEGLKGASPLHTPTTFTDAVGNPIVPTSFGDLVDALVTFRDVVNLPRPPDAWFDALPYQIGSPERALLGVLVEAFPQWLPPSTLATRTGALPNTAENALATLLQDKRVMKHDRGSFRVLPDQMWKRPHLHLGLDSLSGIEKLIHAQVTGTNGVSSMADKEYNQLWIKAQPLWQQVQDLLDSIRRQTGAHIWIVAHCIEDVEAAPTSGEIYKARDIMLKGSGKTLIEIRQFWRQWADSIWYIMRDVEVRKGDKTRRTTATNRGRKLVTAETAQCKAKSRLPIPPVLPATWNDVKSALRQLAPAPPERIIKRILELVPRLEAEAGAQVAAETEKHKASVPHLSAILSRVEGLVACAEHDSGEDGAGESVPESGAQATKMAPADNRGEADQDHDQYGPSRDGGLEFSAGQETAGL